MIICFKIIQYKIQKYNLLTHYVFILFASITYTQNVCSIKAEGFLNFFSLCSVFSTPNGA